MQSLKIYVPLCYIVSFHLLQNKSSAEHLARNRKLSFFVFGLLLLVYSLTYLLTYLLHGAESFLRR